MSSRCLFCCQQLYVEQIQLPNNTLGASQNNQRDYFTSRNDFMYKRVSVIFLLISLIGCSATGDVYSGKEGEEFDVGKTIGLVISAALLYEVAKSGGGGGDSGYSSGVTYMGASADNDDWDYLPGSSQYRCRSISTGQFVSDYLCSDDVVEDSWY